MTASGVTLCHARTTTMCEPPRHPSNVNGRAVPRSYAAVSGSAFLISPKGEVVLFTGSSTDVDMVRVAHVASQRLANGSDVISFCHEDLCVHAAPVAMGLVVTTAVRGLANYKR